VGLLGLTSYGSGFDQLTFTVTDDHSGTQLLSRTFTSLSAATAFFDDDTLSLFKLTRGVDITLNYQLTASQVSGAGISYEVGAVPTPLPGSWVLMLSGLAVFGIWGRSSNPRVQSRWSLRCSCERLEIRTSLP
jgi:hypothetical protein